MANNKPSTASATITVLGTGNRLLYSLENCDYLLILAKREPNICNIFIQVPHLPVM